MRERLRLEVHHVARQHVLEHAPLRLILQAVHRLLAGLRERILRGLERCFSLLAAGLQESVLAAQDVVGALEERNVASLRLGLVDGVLNRHACAVCHVACLRHGATELLHLFGRVVLHRLHGRRGEVADVSAA